MLCRSHVTESNCVSVSRLLYTHHKKHVQVSFVQRRINIYSSCCLEIKLYQLCWVSSYFSLTTCFEQNRKHSFNTYKNSAIVSGSCRTFIFVRWGERCNQHWRAIASLPNQLLGRTHCCHTRNGSTFVLDLCHLCICEAAATLVFLLSLRPQSNVKWFHVSWIQLQKWYVTLLDLCVCHPCVSDRFSQLTSIESTTEHMHSGGLHW